jgi:4-alpha-glucanotransferase
MLRIDHVLGLHRLFWIPPGGRPADGAYVRYPAEELYAILKIESHRHHSIIAGEDLGTVPVAVRRAMSRHGLLRLYVAQLDLLEHPGPLASPGPRTVGSLNTHDMPPFAGWWKRPDHQELRQRLLEGLRAAGALPDGVSDLRSVLEASLRFLGSSPARIALVNLEDLWLETEPQNVPGPPSGNPNWRRRFRYALDEIAASDEIRRLLDAVDHGRRSEGARERGAEPDSSIAK